MQTLNTDSTVKSEFSKKLQGPKKVKKSSKVDLHEQSNIYKVLGLIDSKSLTGWQENNGPP